MVTLRDDLDGTLRKHVVTARAVRVDYALCRYTMSKETKKKQEFVQGVVKKTVFVAGKTIIANK